MQGHSYAIVYLHACSLPPSSRLHSPPFSSLCPQTLPLQVDLSHRLCSPRIFSCNFLFSLSLLLYSPYLSLACWVTLETVTIWALSAEPQFPRPVSYGTRELLQALRRCSKVKLGSKECPLLKAHRNCSKGSEKSRSCDT